MSSLKALTVGHKIFYYAYLFLALLSPQAASALAPPIALYTFQAGSGATVYDVSDNGAPLDLEIANPENTRWIPGGGLTIQQATTITSPGPATKITDALKVSNALTIEAWIEPGNTSQSGPARIVTLSENTGNRNLTLGQSKSAFDVRLRTTRTDLNGMPSLSSAKGVLSSQLTHLVYTRDSKGIVRLFVNGDQRLKTRRRGRLDNWNANHVFGLANEVTGDRPWLGNVYEVAIYDHPFDSNDVGQSYLSGPTTKAAIQNNLTANGESSVSLNSGSSSTSPSSLSTNSNISSNPASGSVSLSWKAPVTRRTGEPLAVSEIAGYTLYYGKEPGNYPSTLEINNSFTTSATISELALGTYYFVVTARDTTGGESGYSSMATRLVQ